MKMLTNAVLRELFPEFKEEIDSVAGKAACGCAGCTLNFLRQKHPNREFRLPEEYNGAVVI